jgi:leucine dehydrogenase
MAWLAAGLYSPPVQVFHEHEQVVICHDRSSGLRAIIALHDTTLGPGLGGIRMWTYPNDEAALTDVLRLSEGMTYKNALAGLPLGGGKTVMLGDPRRDKTDAQFAALGRFVESLGGRYLAAEDVGTTTADAEIVATQTTHIMGLPLSRGGSGDPSPMTAWGVVCGMRAALREVGNDGAFDGVRVAVQGAGHVGADVARHLLEAGAVVTVADIYEDRLEPLRQLGATTVPPADVHAVECDIYSPCALGAVIRPDTIDELNCRIVAGAANNQLATESMGDALVRRGILYAPDFAINAGGVINIGEELGRPYEPERARASVERIEQTLAEVFARSRTDGEPTHRTAIRMARERIDQARAAA